MQGQDQGVDRRAFLQQASAAAGLTILASPRSVVGTEANDRLRLAVFGTMYNAQHFLRASHIYGAEVVALGDPDRRNHDKARTMWNEVAQQLAGERAEDQRLSELYANKARGQGVRFFTDSRTLFDELADEVDALVVSHYDHLHGVTCGPALRAGWPVCTERPLGLTIADARGLRELAKTARKPVTFRSPGTGTNALRRAMELVEDGAIGPVSEAHIWFRRGGPDAQMLPTGEEPVPEALDWNAWLGPLPDRPYHPRWMAYAHWRETSNGGLGSFGPHTTIFPFLALRLHELWQAAGDGGVIQASAEVSGENPISYPRWERVRWQVPARRTMPPATLTWHHGPDLPPGGRALLHEILLDHGVATPEAADSLMASAGSLLVGSRGILVGSDHSTSVSVLPEERFVDVETRKPQRLPESRGLYRDWMDACRGEQPTILADFDHGGMLSELLMLGNIATRSPGPTLNDRTSAGRIADHEAANSHLSMPYREGWRL